MPSSSPSYGDDLAYIHDVGFGSFARHASRRLLAELRRLKLREGRVIELGCGSGITSAALAKAGYDAMMRGEGHEFTGFGNKLQAMMTRVLSENTLARMHEGMAKPGSAPTH